MATINLFLLILFSTISAVIGIVVLVKNSRNAINISFATSALSISVWLVANQLSNTTSSYLLALLLNRIIFFDSSVLSFSLLYFFLIFPENRKIKSYKILFLALPVLLVSVLSAGPWVVKEIAIQTGSSAITFGSLAVVYAVQFIAYIIAALFLLIRKYIRAQGEIKKQLQLLLIGLGVSTVLVLASNVLVPFIFGIFSFTTYGSYFIIFFLLLTSFSILRHHLLDIRLILAEVSTIVVIIALFIQTIISKTPLLISINGIILLTVSYGGWLLIKSVRREIKQREDLAILAKKLEKANEDLKKMDKLKDDFISMASHELNTPVSAIKGYMSMILEEGIGGKIPDQVRGYLEKVYTSSQRLAAMIKDLLNVSRIESGRIHLIFEQKPIEDLIEQAIGEIMPKAKEANHSLTFTRPEKSMPKTWFDVTRIMEVLINIIGNSIKYTDPGGKIEVSVSSTDSDITVAIKDNGRGIPKEKQDQVFSKFTQVDVLKDEVKGTGLGMYISKRFIELHKGKIWFESDGENKGTTFFFSVPIVKEKPFDPHEGEGAVLH